MLAGQGEYQRQQDELNLRAAQMAQQAYQFDQQQQARQQALVAEQQQQAFQNANRNAILGWQRQNEVADRSQQQGWQDSRMGQQRQWEVADLASREQADLNRMQTMAGFQSAAKGGDDVEVEVSKSLAEFGKQRKFLTPEGVNSLNGLQSKYRAIQKARDWARPAEYAEAISQFAAEVQRSDIGKHVNPPKTVEEQVEGGGSFQKPVLDSSGQEIGTAIWTSTVRNGQPTLVPKIIPKKAVVDPREDWLNKNLKNFEDPDTKEIDIDRAMRSYDRIQAWKNSNQSPPGEFVLEYGPSGAPPSVLPPEPPRKPTVRTAATFDEYWGALPPDKRETIEKDSASRIKTEGFDGPPSEERIMEDVRKRLSAIHGFPKGGSEPQLTPEQEMAIFERFRALDAQARGGGRSQSARPATTSGQMETAAQRTLAAYGLEEPPPLPQPQSEAEIAGLPKGARFIAPDGTERVR